MDDRTLTSADNRVHLRGLLAVEPLTRTLPSGDELCSFRLTVRRPEGSYGRARSDSIDCAATRARPSKVVTRCVPGDLIEVSGSLRRRFWRGENGAPASRYEVEVDSARRVAASRRTRASPQEAE